MNNPTMLSHVDSNVDNMPDAVWLRDRAGDNFTEWSWRQARDEIGALKIGVGCRVGCKRNNNRGDGQQGHAASVGFALLAGPDGDP